jgi:hypothetical protein
MNNDVQNFTEGKINPNGNVLIEISLTIVFLSIIVFSCLVLFGS